MGIALFYLSNLEQVPLLENYNLESNKDFGKLGAQINQDDKGIINHTTFL